MMVISSMYILVIIWLTMKRFEIYQIILVAILQNSAGWTKSWTLLRNWPPQSTHSGKRSHFESIFIATTLPRFLNSASPSAGSTMSVPSVKSARLLPPLNKAGPIIQSRHVIPIVSSWYTHFTPVDCSPQVRSKSHYLARVKWLWVCSLSNS